MSVPLRVLTLRTSLYTYIYSQVYIYQESYHGYVGISTCAVHSHTCLCPCECSNFEPVCIHAYAHKHTYVISKNTLVYNPILCKLTNGCALSKCSHLEPLCIHRYTQKNAYFILQILLCMTPCCANLHMSVPLRVLTVRTSLYTCIYSQVYIYQESYHGYVGISTRAVHSHTCLCPCECSHLEPLCIQIFTSISIHTSYHG